MAAAGGEARRLATFAAGCFWGVELTFQGTPGVLATRVGYTGGIKDNPTYQQVCSGTTGHAEAVEVTYDPAATTYHALLGVFWKKHDPTQLNRQGWDIGSQYRSAIFYHDEEQMQQAQASLQQEQERRKSKVVTQIVAAEQFWPAEEYHQSYLQKKRGIKPGTTGGPAAVGKKPSCTVL